MKGTKQFQGFYSKQYHPIHHLHRRIATAITIVAFLLLSFFTMDAGRAEEFTEAFTTVAPVVTTTPAPEQNTGQAIFTNTCTACHIGGTNVIVPQKTLTQEALEKYAMDSIGAIKQQVTYGKNAMPAFGNRLTPEQIDAVANYILEQANAGW